MFCYYRKNIYKGAGVNPPPEWGPPAHEHLNIWPWSWPQREDRAKDKGATSTYNNNNNNIHLYFYWRVKRCSEAISVRAPPPPDKPTGPRENRRVAEHPLFLLVASELLWSSRFTEDEQTDWKTADETKTNMKSRQGDITSKQTHSYKSGDAPGLFTDALPASFSTGDTKPDIKPSPSSFWHQDVCAAGSALFPPWSHRTWVAGP